MNKIAEVIISNSVRQLGKVFHYLIPENLYPNIKIGQLVSVPFGNSNRTIEAFVVGITDHSEIQELKYIKDIVIESELFKDELIELAIWMSKQYMCNIYDCLRLMLPPVSSLKSREKTLHVSLLKSKEEILGLIGANKIKAVKQVDTLKYLLSNETCSASDITKECNSSYNVLRTLEKKELIEIKEEVLDKDPLRNKLIGKTLPFTPNNLQKNAIDQISVLLDKNQPAEVLVHGVTGSGKTEVYLQLISKVLENNKQAIVLVPEISLTPQMIQRFVGRFGNQVAVLHSRLSDGERSDQWHKIKEGKVRVVVGARSAVFAPFKNLGIIIIDEEHEHTYKSEKTPKYHAKNIARQRSILENCVVVLGSATPSIETYYQALQGKIDFVQLPQRANNSALPEVEIVDMRNELDDGNKSIFSRSLYNAIKKNIENNNQTILFLNKRGYSSFVLCRKCGYVEKCKNCNISLTYHLQGERLVCHYCGYNRSNLKLCPSCGSNYIRHFGVGTQKLEEEVKKHFSNATVLRMDLDTTSRKNSHEEILNKFREENINILIGTQMIAKGHDFPNVTLVGVISADLMLNMEDFRSTEKTFQLLTQVAGRAGRAQKKGKVIVQTYEVDNFSIQTAKDQDYISYYNQEIIIRNELNYPPFCDIVSILISSDDEVKIKGVANRVESIIREELKVYGDKILILKALPAPISKIKNKFRWRVIIKCNMDEQLRDRLNDVIKREAGQYEKWCSISTDVNPLSML